ncbi:baseplate J/gp47 family protein [Desulforamulus ruminis]|uniref:Baseplate J family protein n=1 Tax=Desulforamulus ruminis (strain ATCC 23193 / DSM 2154 / NCIMB 8452 / DL) TaxID=696281 RepID=F6DLQ4_DESRL|nr:baseplate J/gp47 family protein [Desulforamulus ruminis]AEG61696.1 Baseplate J family protein [Desulforamulus ruminis DSM 2154]
MTTLPDYLNDQTLDAIRQRMLENVPADMDKSEGSFIWDALSPAAIELALAALWGQEVLQRGFAGTTFGPYLDLRCDEHGITRRQAVKATGQIKFNGTAGTVVPAGTVVATPADPATNNPSTEFITVSEEVIDSTGVGYADLEAVQAGKDGNVGAGTINIMITPVGGISAVLNNQALTGGADEEDDATLLSRFYAKVRTPGTSGNKADYVNWALEVPGVGGVQVLPLADGAGTVKVVLLGTDKKPAVEPIVSKVQDYISPSPGGGEGKAPIGAKVTVVSAEPVDVHVSATVILTGAKTLAEVQASFEKSLDEYLGSIAFAADPTARYVRIGSLLLDTEGVQDYTGMTVNEGTANVAIDQGQVAVKGTVTLA